MGGLHNDVLLRQITISDTRNKRVNEIIATLCTCQQQNIREFNWKMKKKNMEKLSLVPRPICGRGKNGLVSIVCACAEYSTIRGVSDLYVNSP